MKCENCIADVNTTQHSCAPRIFHFFFLSGGNAALETLMYLMFDFKNCVIRVTL